MHVLDLVARSVKESIAEDDSSSFVEVLYQSFVPIRRNREWGPEVWRKAFPETRGFTIEKCFHIPFGYPLFAVRGETTLLRLCCTRSCNVQVDIGSVEVVFCWTT